LNYRLTLLFLWYLDTAAVVKHFDDFHEDQFDFHAYCVRKVTLRAYTEVLRFEDTLLSEDYYFRAASGTIGIYLHLHDHPAIMDEDKEPEYSKMSAAERKKTKAIARKKKNQADKKEADKKKKEEEEAQNGDKKGKPGADDEDPDGKELMKKDALEEAKNFSSILAKYSPKRLETWTLQYDVSIRRNKTLLALQALFKMKSIAPNHSEYFSRIVDFAVKMPTFTDIPDAVKSVITQESATLLNQKTATEFVAEAADRARKDATTDLPSRVAIAQALAKTSPSSTDAAASIIVNGGVNTMGVSVETCRQALAALKSLKAEAATKEWIIAVKERFPLLSDLS
jgi:peptide alpha-N-acetyltransferase